MIHGVSNSTQPSIPPAAREVGNERTSAEQQQAGSADAVELSSAAREQLEQGDAQAIRSELVERVRNEISQGEYLTEDKLDSALDRLTAALFAV